MVHIRCGKLQFPSDLTLLCVDGHMEMEGNCECKIDLGKVAKRKRIDVYSNGPPSVPLPRLSPISPTACLQLNPSGY